MGLFYYKQLIILSTVTGVILQATLSVNGKSEYSELKNLKPTQRETLATFKNLVMPMLAHNYMKEDIWLVKILSYNNFKIQKSKEHLQEILKWREENKLDDKSKEPYSEYFPELQKDYPIFMDGYDKQDRPICEVPYGSWQVRKAAVAGIIHKLSKHLVFGCAERGFVKIREQQALGKNVTQFIFLGNMEGLAISDHICPICLPLAISLATLNEKYYPNTAGPVWLLNAPDSISTLLRLVRPVMSSTTRASFKVFSSNEQEWKPFLEKRVNFSEISNWYGGAKDRSTL